MIKLENVGMIEGKILIELKLNVFKNSMNMIRDLVLYIRI